MTLEDTDKIPAKGGTIPAESGRNLRGAGRGVSSDAAKREPCCPPEREVFLMEAVVERENMKVAYARVVSNRGAAGVDGMTVEDLKAHLVQHWPSIKEELLRGKYQPQPVLGVQIPKPGGGERQLGIPTVVDRLIQQALHQVLSPIFEPDFSESSYGFRPGRSAHQAVRRARELVREGRRWVVDMDLEKFLDPASHYTPFHESPSKRSGCVPITLMHKPFEFLGHRRTGDGSPSFTQCDTVSRARPGIPNASSMGISPSNIPPETPELSSLAMSDAPPRCARVVTLTSKEAINYHWRVPARCGISKAFEAAADFAAMGEIDCCNAIPASPVSSSSIVVIADKSRITVWRHHHTA